MAILEAMMNLRLRNSNKARNSAILLSSLLCLSSLAGVSSPAATPCDGGPKDLFYRQMRDTSARLNNIGLTYSIEVVRKNEVSKVDSRFPFKSGDQIKFHVQSNIDGYMYVVMKSGASGAQAVLFPAEGSGEENVIKKGEDYVLPGEGVLEFDNQPGEEHLQLIVSAQKLDLANAMAAGRSRQIIITPKTPCKPVANTQIDLPLTTNASWSNTQSPPSFKQEPAVTVVSTETAKPLSLELVLKHEGAVISPKVASTTSRESGPESSKTATEKPATPVETVRATQGSSVVPTRTGDPALNSIVADKWAVVVGISQFKDPKWNLLYADKDARDFAKFLTNECNFSADHVKVLTNADATREKILTNLGAQFLPQNVKPGDLVVIYFATHGTGADQDVAKKNFLVAHDTDVTNPFASGIEIQDLARTIKRRINADRILIVLDTCHAGVAEPGAKALGPTLPIFDFKDLAQGTGQLIIGSAGANQTAHDSLRYNNGVFTRHFMDGLRKHKKFAEAFEYTKQKVEEETVSDFRQRQTPILKDAEWKGDELKVGVPPTKPRKPLGS